MRRLLVLLQFLLVVGIEAGADPTTLTAVETSRQVHPLLDHEGTNTAELLPWDRVTIHMHVEVGLLGEAFATDCTLVWPLTTVDPPVDLHVVFEAETLPTNVALVGLLPRVNDLVAA